MTQWRCEACGAVYERERATCRSCEGGSVERFEERTAVDDGSSIPLESVTDSEKAESFQSWRFVDWMILGITLGGLASMVLGVLRIVGA